MPEFLEPLSGDTRRAVEPADDAGVRSAIQGLLDRLDAEADEGTVLSLAASRDPGGSWRLRAGSVLLGPPAMSTLAWSEWAAADALDTERVDLSVFGVDVTRWRIFDHRHEDWRFVRCAMSVPSAADWLVDLIATGKATCRVG